MNKILGRNQALQNLLMIFAEFFKFPEEDFFEEIKRGEIDEQIGVLSKQAGYPITTCFMREIHTYEQLVESFNSCFLGMEKPFAPPIESVYKQWTTDESYQVPFKQQKGYLMGDPAHHVQHILKAFNLEIPVEYDLMPDHLTILLEVLAYLIGQGFLKEAKQFKEDHLDWLADFRKALDELQKGHFYKYGVKELERFLGLNIL
ncbi:TorD/DmsD family molecular chaperone [Desulfosporosinus youngiae]|uniref:Putative component of anaerobic dehydrogenase n=1 Tax=Desulfosporosinus youngiae DSM 17734 TaxID=768710 RepID=H5Y4S4_9FIRM|nr:molecular chaperone TorD family protein [Desulfosporosinus youngiae]EHQ89810.1 putative component of anaerobic dehydrogenase [Desulfosporosinus youngiae DSM 17734]